MKTKRSAAVKNEMADWNNRVATERAEIIRRLLAARPQADAARLEEWGREHGNFLLQGLYQNAIQLSAFDRSPLAMALEAAKALNAADLRTLAAHVAGYREADEERAAENRRLA